MATHRLIAPIQRRSPITVNGRTYDPAVSVIDAPDFDSVMLQANGWTLLGSAVTEAGFPKSPVLGQAFWDTDAKKLVAWNGKSWRDASNAIVGAPTMRHVTNRSHIFSSVSNAYASSMMWVWQSSPIPLTALQVIVPNWYVRQSDGAEVGPGAATTMGFGVYYNGVATVLPIGGQATAAIADGANGISDYTTLPATIPANTPFLVGIYMANAVNMLNVNFANTHDPSRGDIFKFNGTNSTATGPGALVDDGASFGTFPGLVRAMSSLDVWGGFGDSLTNGVNDQTPDATGATGWFGRGFFAKGVPYANFGCSGDQMQWFVANSSKRMAFAGLAGVTKAILAYGTNDIIQARTQAQFEADRATAIGLFNGIPVYNCSIVPQTTGGPASSAQTPVDATKNTRRIAINTSARAGIAGSAGFIDIAAAVETNNAGNNTPVLNGGVWLTNAYGEGTHPSSAGYDLVTPLVLAL